MKRLILSILFCSSVAVGQTTVWKKGKLDTLSSRLGTSIVVTDTVKFGKTVRIDSMIAIDTVRIRRPVSTDSSINARSYRYGGTEFLSSDGNIENIGTAKFNYYLKLRDYDNEHQADGDGSAFVSMIARDSALMVWDSKNGLIIGKYSNGATPAVGSGSLQTVNKVIVGTSLQTNYIMSRTPNQPVQVSDSLNVTGAALSVSNESGAATIGLSTAYGYQGAFSFYNQDRPKWSIAKNADSTFQIYSYGASRNALLFSHGLGEGLITSDRLTLGTTGGIGTKPIYTNGYYVGTTQIIDGSRNLSNIGTISSGAITSTGDLAVNGGDLTSTASTFNLLNSGVTTANLFGAATSLTLGATTGTATLRNATVNFSNATALQLGGTTWIDASRNLSNIGTIFGGGSLIMTGNPGVIRASTIASGQNALLQLATGASLRWQLNKNTTAESGGNAGSNLLLQAYDDAGTFLGTVLDVTRATGAMTIGSFGDAFVDIKTNGSNRLSISGTGNTTLTGDLAVNGGDLTSTATTFNLLNSTVTTLNVGGAANVNIGGSAKTVTTGGSFKIRTGATIDSIKVVSDTLRIYVGGVGFKAVP